MSINISDFKRILIKLSGESIEGNILDYIANDIKKIVNAGKQVSLVIGGGNIIRGKNSCQFFNKNNADYIGMLATVMNAIRISDKFNSIDLTNIIQAPFNIHGVCNDYCINQSFNNINKGSVIIFAGGLGAPAFSTDTTAVVRSIEMQCEVLIKATKVDGVYDCDPILNSKANKYDHISFDDILKNKIDIMDLNAIFLAKQNALPIVVFNHNNSIFDLINGKVVSNTIIS